MLGVFDSCSISSGVIGLFRLFASSSFSFGRLHFSRNVSISSRFSNFLVYSFFVVISYNPLYFCGISCSLPSFISDCVYLGPLSFFLDEPASGLSILSFQSSSSWIRCSLQLCFYSLCHLILLLLVISFLVLALDFVCCSSCSCWQRVRLFIRNVSIFFK